MKGNVVRIGDGEKPLKRFEIVRLSQPTSIKWEVLMKASSEDDGGLTTYNQTRK